MSILVKALIEGLIVGAAICILGKGQEVLSATKKAHGTNWHWDVRIVRRVLADRYGRTLAIGALSGVVYAAISVWADAVG